ncbi:MAG: hypothetical protein AAFQ66_09210 [Pseudomonadota bacterium]
MAIAELIDNSTSPLDSAVYDSETGRLILVFSYDDVLRNDDFDAARHIDGLVVNGNVFEIELHADDGPRDSNGFIYNEDTVENEFDIFIGTDIDISNGLELTFSDNANGTRPLYTVSLDFQTPEPPVEPEPEPEPPTVDEEIKVYLYDADTDERLLELNDGTVIPAELVEGRNVSLVAETDGNAESMRMVVDGVHAQTENFLPYALFGDKSGDLNGQAFLEAGASYDIALTAYSGNGLSGSAVGSLDLSISVADATEPAEDPVTPPEPEESTISLFVYDAQTDQLVGEITDGGEIPIALLAGGNGNIVAQVNGPEDAEVESMVLEIEGLYSQTESAAPYAIFGNRGGDYHSGPDIFEVGESYSILMTAYTGNGGSGDVVVAETMVFDVA